MEGPTRESHTHTHRDTDTGRAGNIRHSVTRHGKLSHEGVYLALTHPTGEGGGMGAERRMEGGGGVCVGGGGGG